ncbi:MAG: hypothetical protein ABI318_00640 [Chthoniobacteraceae bacterium]
MSDSASQHSDPDYKYWAFISYSHQDNLPVRGDGSGDHIPWANWLHEQLETFRIPDGEVDTTRLLPEEPIAAEVRVKDTEPPREMHATERDQPDRRALLDFMKLKLIAGLMGAGLDELVQRDKRRADEELRRVHREASRTEFLFARQLLDLKKYAPAYARLSKAIENDPDNGAAAVLKLEEIRQKANCGLLRQYVHEDGVVSAVFCTDGVWVLTASQDSTARDWNCESGESVDRGIARNSTPSCHLAERFSLSCGCLKVSRYQFGNKQIAGVTPKFLSQNATCLVAVVIMLRSPFGIGKQNETGQIRSNEAVGLVQRVQDSQRRRVRRMEAGRLAMHCGRHHKSFLVVEEFLEGRD